MIKKTILSLTILILLLFLVSCAPKPSEEPTVKPEAPTPTVTPTEEVPTTGEAPVDEVAEDISDTGTMDDELSTSELEDIEDVLADIGNI